MQRFKLICRQRDGGKGWNVCKRRDNRPVEEIINEAVAVANQSDVAAAPNAKKRARKSVTAY